MASTCPCHHTDLVFQNCVEAPDDTGFSEDKFQRKLNQARIVYDLSNLPEPR